MKTLNCILDNLNSSFTECKNEVKIIKQIKKSSEETKIFKYSFEELK